jgi:hypothetical protein
MKRDPELLALIERIKAFLEYCDDTSLPRPPGVTHEAIPVSEPEVK